MKNQILLIIIIVILLVILTTALKDRFSISVGSKSKSNNIVSPTPNTGSGLKTKESSEGPVAVTVTPRSLENGSPTWDFEITLNTHTEELSEDLVVVSELMDDQGKFYKPISWEGDNPGGHHREGILKFNPIPEGKNSFISPKPKSLELKIKNVGGVTERSFKWNL